MNKTITAHTGRVSPRNVRFDHKKEPETFPRELISRNIRLFIPKTRTIIKPVSGVDIFHLLNKKLINT